MMLWKKFELDNNDFNADVGFLMIGSLCGLDCDSLENFDQKLFILEF